MESWSTSSFASGWVRADFDAARLPRSFYERSTLRVARELLGKVLCVGRCALRIVETEAYHGTDPASHGCRGRTARNAVMFGPGGVVYVYFIYGMYEMLNFVTEAEGYPGAVLIRAGEPLAGHALMRRRRGAVSALASGPGRLTRALGIRMKDNGALLEGPRVAVFDDGWRPESISCSPRVGITLGAERPWRYFVTGHRDVSRAPQNAQARVLAGRGA